MDGIWSVHVSDLDCPLLFTNGKGSSKLAALASALGEFFERLSCNYFWAHYYPVSYTHLDVYKRQDLFGLFDDTVQRLLEANK